MVAEMRVTNVNLRKEKDAYQEINRILLRENIDLRDTLDAVSYTHLTILWECIVITKSITWLKVRNA